MAKAKKTPQISVVSTTPLAPAPRQELLPRKPNEYTPELAAEICRRMSEGESVNSICRDPTMPRKPLVYAWLREIPEFMNHYARALEARAEHWAEEIVDIADDSTNDFMERQLPNGKKVIAVDQENINRSRARIDARKWLLSKLMPKKYGDKLDVSVSPRKPPDLGIDWDDGGPGEATAARLEEALTDEPGDEE